MSFVPPEIPSPAPGRGRGLELWLLAPGREEQFEARRSAFEGTGFALVLGATDPPQQDWGARLARAFGIPFAACPELDSARAAETLAEVAERAWTKLAHALATSPGPILALLAPTVVQAATARGFGFALERCNALTVDPGRAVCLRDDPGGIALRRVNVRGHGSERLDAFFAHAPDA